jgi:hypothetical protein
MRSRSVKGFAQKVRNGQIDLQPRIALSLCEKMRRRETAENLRSRIHSLTDATKVTRLAGAKSAIV